ncbi:ketopantoate reductase family protein [Gracilibacillus kekensis]|uniref:2-dehydropantoate 2-reductase n=1 Tax=Gracilibacillus kekensis TaxID=1027249 RepID=A0A1M7MXS5_9BACI|nr:ketopantoate reductase family protein [Gracilibacillus kekensis]SHM95437.1 ketopantoate reductase [Gracilibacillus kekensis]
MNIAIIGAGALGSYFGARWIKAGANVQFIVREKRAAQLKKYGLKINSVHGNDLIESPDLVTDPASANAADIIVIAVKGYHLNGIIDTVSQMIDENTYILPILNGFQHYSILFDHFGKDKVLGGLANIIATLDEFGHVVHTSKIHEIRFGALLENQQEVCEKLAVLSEDAKMASSYSHEILMDIWYKYMFITAFSGITTVSNLEIGSLLKQEATKSIIDHLLKEMQIIAKHEGVVLGDQHLDKAWQTLNNLPADATSSMHQDYRKGLNIEVDHLQGAAINLAKKHQLDVPYLETIYGIIKVKTS